MKVIKTLLALLTLLTVQAQTIPSYRVDTMDDLLGIRLNTSSIPVAWVANRSSEYDGGGGTFFYDGRSRAATNSGTIFKPIYGEGRWIRSYNSLETDFFGRTTALLNEALSFAVRAKIEFPRNVDLFITSPLLPKSYSTLIGNGARLMNGATNVNGLILMLIDRTMDTEVLGLRFDHQLGSHWNTGHLVVRGSTNIYVHNCEFQRAGYLASFLAQVASDGARSEGIRFEHNYVGDQIYGGSSQSTANVSIAESTKDATVANNRIVYSTLGQLNLGWVPLGQGNPNHPRLIVGLDRGFNSRFVDNEVVNMSGATNLCGLMLEDNTGATNILSRVRGNTFSKLDVGMQTQALRGAAVISENVFDQCNFQGLYVNQTISTDAHQLSFLTVQDNLFLNCNPNPQMGQTTVGSVWRNDAGQVSYIASLPFRMLFQGNQILGWSQSANTTAFLYGGGHLSFINNRIEQLGNNTAAVGLRAADPAILNEAQANAMYQATARNRKPFYASKNQFVGFATGKSMVGVSDAFGDSTVDNYGQRVQWGSFRKQFATNLVSKLFSIHTVEANQTSIGNSGAWTAFIFLNISNQPLDLYSLGNVGTHGRIFCVSQAVNELSTPTAVNSVDQIFAGTQAKTGARGYTSLVMTAVSTFYHTTEIRLSFSGEGDVTDGTVYGSIMLVSSDMYMLPQILD